MQEPTSLSASCCCREGLELRSTPPAAIDTAVHGCTLGATARCRGVYSVLQHWTGCAAPIPDGESATYRKLHADLTSRKCKNFRFVRVPGPYYEKPLEFRAERVGAASRDHLCKTMVMENTRAPDDVTDCSNPKLSKYYMVLVQYTAAIDAEKLKAFVHKVCTYRTRMLRGRLHPPQPC